MYARIPPFATHADFATRASRAVPLLGALLFARPILQRPGFPAYQHDWSWPFSRGSALLGALGHISAWNPFGLGSPNPLASGNPIDLLLTLAPALTSPVAAGKILFLVVMVLAAYGAFAAAARVGATAWGSACASIAYICSPVLVNKVGAGHIGFWWAYALLPWLFWLPSRIERARSVRPFAAVALVAALIAVQPQFIFFGAVALVASLCAIDGNLRAKLTALAAWFVGSVVAVVPPLVSFTSATAYEPELFPHPKLAWEAGMSTKFPDVLWLTHYSTPYYERVSSHWEALAIVAGIASAVALFVAPSRVRWAGLTMAIVGLFFASGTQGPAGMLWSFAYEHITAATIFREGAHAESLVSLAYVVAYASLSSVAPRRWALASALILPATVPWLCGDIGSVVTNVDRAVSTPRVATSTIPGRIAALPLISPISLDGREPGGVDVLAPGTATHPSLSEYPTMPPLTIYGLTACGCESWFLHAMRASGVAAVVRRANMHSDDLTRMGLSFRFDDRAAVVDVGGHMAAFARVAIPLNPSLLAAAEPSRVQLTGPSGPLPPHAQGEIAVVVPRAPSAQPDDPAIAWVSMMRWYGLARRFLPSTASGVITSSRAALRVTLAPGHAWFVLHANDAPMMVASAHGRSRLPATLRPRWDRVPDGTLTIAGTGGVAMIGRFAAGREFVPLRTFDRPRVIEYERRWPWAARLRIAAPPHGPLLLVFRDRYARGWHVIGARTIWHGIADGYANAFEIVDPARTVTISYAPENRLLAALVASWAIVACLVILMLVPARVYVRDQPQLEM